MSKQRSAFEGFARKASEELGDSLNKLVLYGSLARGDENASSDVDVFAVVNDKEDLEVLRDLAFEIGLIQHGVHISVQGVIKESFEQRKDHPFINTVLTEGEVYV